jgi:hypothetical protein
LHPLVSSLTAGAQSDVTVRSVKLSGLGDENNQLSYTAPEFAQVVTACDLYDGETKLGTTQSLDSAGGTIQISNVNLLIAKGTSKTLVAKCTADSAVVHANGDFFKVGIGIRLTTSLLKMLTTTRSRSLLSQALLQLRLRTLRTVVS